MKSVIGFSEFLSAMGPACLRLLLDQELYLEKRRTSSGILAIDRNDKSPNRANIHNSIPRQTPVRLGNCDLKASDLLISSPSRRIAVDFNTTNSNTLTRHFSPQVLTVITKWFQPMCSYFVTICRLSLKVFPYSGSLWLQLQPFSILSNPRRPIKLERPRLLLEGHSCPRFTVA